MIKIPGTIMSEGLAIGNVVIPQMSMATLEFTPCEDKDAEKIKVNKALKVAITSQQMLINHHSSGNKDTRDILMAYLFMLKDPDLKVQIHQAIDNEGCSAPWAVKQVFDSMIMSLYSCDDSYMKSRGEDLSNVMNRLVDILQGRDHNEPTQIKEGSILVFNSISPSQFAALDLSKVAGFISATGSAGSHIAIMARAAQIPAICCKADDIEKISSGQSVVLDSVNATIIVNPKQDILARYINTIMQRKEILKEELEFKNKASKTKDGVEIPVEANISSLKDMPSTVEYHASGIGLVRTEFLFENGLPSCQEQFEKYKKILEMMSGKPVVFRLLDVGGDKLSSLNNYKEDNPFLGNRGIRLLTHHKDVIATQIKALLMASPFGDATILLPMISSVDEVRVVKKVIKKIKKELIKDNILFDDKIKVGAMIEVPSAAILADEIAKEVDLFSIGTNDLTQYTLAVDRTNPLVASLYNNCHPAVLKLMEMTVNAADKAGIPVCVCGEMASQINMVRLLLGLGIDKISISPNMICSVRHELSKYTMEENIHLANRAKRCISAEAVYALLRN